MPSSVGSLLELCEGYRVLGPVFQKLRDRFHGNTLIPNALSPILPGMAFGYQQNCGEIRKVLEANSAWLEWRPKLERAYATFCQQSGNEVLWAAWNHWDPSKPVDKQRMIQVVIGGNAAITERAQDGTPLIRLNRVELIPSEMTAAGEALRARCDLPGSGDILTNRDYAEGIWQELFRPSFSRFEKGLGLLTIVDYLRERLRTALTAGLDDTKALAPHAFIFGASTTCSNAAIVADLSEAVALWDWTAELGKNAAGSTACEQLINTWVEAAELLRDGSADVPRNVLDIIARFASQLGIEKLDEAYVILQHILWFRNALRSECQYVLPVASGAHFSAMYLATKVPLQPSDLMAWHQLAVQLFSTLIVHHLTDLLRRADELRAADEQRVVLSHSIPKFVFKPMEYFATKLAMHSVRNDAHQKIAKTLLFLSSRGQAALAEYAPPVVEQEPYGVSGSSDAQPFDLAEVCDNVREVFDNLRDFLVHGYVDRVVSRVNGRASFRDELCTAEAIVLKQNVSAPCLVVGNRGLVTLHLWNLIDNAFRFADFNATFKNTDKKLRDVLVITLEGEMADDGVYKFRASNTGTPITQPQLQRLNALFTNRPQTTEFLRAQGELASKRDLDFPVGLEHERSGIGLSRFAEYLWIIWGNKAPANGVGLVEKFPNGTSFSFLFPTPK